MFSEYHSICIVIAQIDRRGGIIKAFQLNATCLQFMGYIENQVWTGLKGPIRSVTDQWHTGSGRMGTSMWTDRQNDRKTGQKITFPQLGWRTGMTPIRDSLESFGCYQLFCKTVGLVTVVLSEDDQVDVMKGDFVGIDLSAGPAAIALVPERGKQ